MNVPIAIASYGRAELLSRKSPFVEHAYVLVEKWEVDEYRETLKRYNREPLGVIALEENWGCGDLRNKCLDQMWAIPGVDAVWTLDDDIEAIATTTLYRERKLSVEESVQAIAETCRSAAEAGTGLCGFCKLLSTEFRVFKPITLVGALDDQAAGHIDKDMRYDPNITMGHIADLTLWAVRKWGFIWRDNRYRPWNGPNWTVGGSARWRTHDDISNGHEYINSKWRRHAGGQDVIVPIGMYRPGRGGAVQTGLTRRIRFDRIGAEGP